MTRPSPIQVRQLEHVALYVRDLQASEHFYELVLALPRIPRPAFDFPGAWFALGEQELHLVIDAAQTGEHRRDHYALLVDDVDAAKAELERRGVGPIDGPQLRPDGARQIYFHDPDGYRIEMVSYPTRAAEPPAE